MTCVKCGIEQNQVDFNLELNAKICEACRAKWEADKAVAAEEFMRETQEGRKA